MNTIWDDLEHLSDDAFMLYVWSWTNTKCGMAGIYKIARHKLVEGRFDSDRLTTALAECETNGLLRYVDGVLWNVARVKRLSGISSNYAKSIARDVREVEDNPLFGEFMERYGDFNEKLTDALKGSEGSKGSNPSGNLDEGFQDGSTEPSDQGLPKGSRRDHGHGHGPGHGSSSFKSVFSALERVAFARNAPSAKPDAVIRACEEFASIEHVFAVEAENFASYWIDGPGEKQSMGSIAWHWRNWLGNVKPEEAPKVTKAPTSKRDYSRYDAVVEPAG